MSKSPELLFALVLRSVFCFSAQEAHGAGQNATTQTTIDGSLHPELISDDQALRIWLIAICEAPDATPAELQRMRVKIGAAALSSDDSALVIKTATHFGDAVKTLRNRQQSLDRPDTSSGQRQRQQLIADEDQLFTESRSSLMGGLSSEGKQKLAAHLLHVKQHMRIGAGPNMGDQPQTQQIR